jgi:hypothetical protein
LKKKPLGGLDSIKNITRIGFGADHLTTLIPCLLAENESSGRIAGLSIPIHYKCGHLKIPRGSVLKLQ